MVFPFLAEAQLREIVEDKKVLLALQIARTYDLTRDQAILLLAIRDHEAGRPGKEFGVESDKRAMIFKDGTISFMVQCGFAAETIKKRCPDTKNKTLKKFGDIYATDPGWWWKVKRKMKQYQNILY